MQKLSSGGPSQQTSESLAPTCQREFRQVVAGVSSRRGQQGDGRVGDVFAVGQVQTIQLRHVALQEPQGGLADVQTGQTERRHVPQSAARRLGSCRDRHGAAKCAD